MTAGSGRLVVRAPNHLGDLVMALPALTAADADAIAVSSGLLPFFALAGLRAETIGLDRGLPGLARATSAIRRGDFERGVLLTRSFSSALAFRVGGVRRIRGSGTDRREALLDEVVARTAIDALHRSSAYWLLVTGETRADIPVPAVEVPARERQRWVSEFGAGGGRIAGIFPGGHASSRRWPADRFAEIARALAADGLRVIVFGAAGERALTRAVAGDWAVDAGGRTDLLLLAAGLAACDILVTNDSGPMHLAAAVGTPTLSLWGAGDPDATGPIGPQHRRLRRSDLPCVPCVRNTCPRRGEGYLLPEAERECLKLIETADVLRAVREAPA